MGRQKRNLLETGDRPHGGGEGEGAADGLRNERTPLSTGAETPRVILLHPLCMCLASSRGEVFGGVETGRVERGFPLYPHLYLYLMSKSPELSGNPLTLQDISLRFWTCLRQAKHSCVK